MNVMQCMIICAMVKVISDIAWVRGICYPNIRDTATVVSTKRKVCPYLENSNRHVLLYITVYHFKDLPFWFQWIANGMFGLRGPIAVALAMIKLRIEHVHFCKGSEMMEIHVCTMNATLETMKPKCVFNRENVKIARVSISFLLLI